jgi:hypothetical protein
MAVVILALAAAISALTLVGAAGASGLVGDFMGR